MNLRWSAIAARLPGRTDNEIKNYWNTHIRKRLLKMGIDPVTHSPRLDLMGLIIHSQIICIQLTSTQSFELARTSNSRKSRIVKTCFHPLDIETRASESSTESSTLESPISESSSQPVSSHTKPRSYSNASQYRRASIEFDKPQLPKSHTFKF